MAGLTPLPPFVVHSSTRLTHAQAQAHLSSFLEIAQNDASYRPESVLSQRGPQSTTTTSNPDLTLYYLRRILKGIEGKRMVGDDMARFFGEGAKVAGPRKRKFEGEVNGQVTREQVGDKNPEDAQLGPGVAVDKELNGWMEKDQYDLAQDDNGLDAHGEERHPGAHLEEPANVEEAEEMAEITIEDSGKAVGLSEQRAKKSTAEEKRARKEAKKERSKIQRREKENAKAKAKAAR